MVNGADDTDSEEDEGLEKEEVAVANELSASSDSSEIKPKKVSDFIVAKHYFTDPKKHDTND